MKNIRIEYLLIVVFLTIFWNISAWLIERNSYNSRVKEIVEQKTKMSQERADDLADSINKNLNYLHGIPELLSNLIRVKAAVSRFGADRNPSRFPVDERKKRWTKDSRLNDLSRYFDLAKNSLGVDIIYLVNASGDCIAASNWDTSGSTIGTNFVDRDFFQKNVRGQNGIQYAVGKTTKIPGLYFSTPVFINGHFLGAVVAKTDIPNLSFLIKELNAFVTDENGIIVLARDKNIEMLSFPDAAIAGMSEQKRLARYQRSKFTTLQIAAWTENRFSSLVRIQNKLNPYVLVSKDIGKYGLKAYVKEEIGEINAFNHEATWFTFLLGLTGSTLILMAVGAILYLKSVKTEQIAIGRANLAERGIISISEDTQQRIGQELHDDLGQLLTGVAFMSEVLYKRLQAHDHVESQEVSKITSLLNQAISKTRNLAHGLFPVDMKGAGLPAMLNNLTKSTEEIYQIECEFSCANDCKISDSLVVINLFRIAQEAINNAVKHSGATKITLNLYCEPTSLTLVIADNGCGIDNSTKQIGSGGVGMSSMRYRASLLGGVLSLRDLPSGGTSVTINLQV